MKRLIKKSEKNSPQEYSRIFHERAREGPDWQDERRWKYLMKYYRDGNLLDLGCLDSEIPKFMNPTMYTGVDLAEEAIKEMQKKYPRACYEVGDIYDLPKVIKIFSYSYVILGEVLEHLEYPEKAINEAWQILRKDGILAISVPFREEIAPGAVDGERHLWSFDEWDILNMLPGMAETRTKTLRSKWFPKYKYCFPQLIIWAKKL